MLQKNNPSALQQGSDPADLFGFKLNYNIVEGSATAANKLYNGNIAETFWSTATDGGFVRNYGYKYDQLNRLKDATYQKSGQLTGMYNENLSYDKNGNIMNLSRYGDRDEQYLPIQIDNLGYNYATNSNKLMSVVDNSNNTSGFKDGITTGDDYVYDANGNMTVDKNKNITAITYNHLNLPTKIIFPTGNIVYFYNASGQKGQKVVTENAAVTTTDYLGGYQYQNTVLQFFPTAEGYVKNTPVSGSNTYSYVFNYTDHLGNTRLSYTKDAATSSLKILEESNYYPFGLMHKGYNNLVSTNNPAEKLLFNGKELQDELNLNTYDFGARMYDPSYVRTPTQDPLAEKFYSYSSYSLFNNNPIFFIDPTGMAAEPPGDYYDKNGNWLGKDKYDDNKVYYADSVEKNKDGLVVSAKNSTDLGITHSKFLFASQTLYAESSPKTSKLEVAGIFSVLENRAQAYGTDVISQMSPKYPMGVYGSREKDRNRYFETGSQADAKRLTVRAGLILGLTSTSDYSNGAFFWDGVDFKSGGGHNERYVPGYLFSDKSHDIYNFGNNIKHGSTKFGSWDYKYESTGAIGKTIFSKLSDAWRDAQYPGNSMTKPLGN